MHFLLFIFLAANQVTSANVQNSIIGLSKRSDFQLPGEDLTVTLQDSPVDLFDVDGSNNAANPLFNGGDDNLFADSNGAIDSYSSVGALGAGSFDLAEASPSCLSDDGSGQSLSKLRTRDGVCLPNGQPSGGIDEFVNNALGIFGNPFDKKGQEKQSDLSTPVEQDLSCDPRFPNRLCCEEEGELDSTMTASINSLGMIYRSFDICSVRTCFYSPPEGTAF